MKDACVQCTECTAVHGRRTVSTTTQDDRQPAMRCQKKWDELATHGMPRCLFRLQLKLVGFVCDASVDYKTSRGGQSRQNRARARRVRIFYRRFLYFTISSWSSPPLTIATPPMRGGVPRGPTAPRPSCGLSWCLVLGRRNIIPKWWVHWAGPVFSLMLAGLRKQQRAMLREQVPILPHSGGVT